MAHLIVWSYCLGIPVISNAMLKRMKAHPSDKGKVRAYSVNYVINALILAFAFFNGVQFEYSSGKVSPWLWIPAAGLLIHFVGDIALDVYGVLRRPEFRRQVAEVYRERSYIQPTTRRQISMFYGVAIIVGIVEELFYRSYLPTYLQELGLPYWTAVITMMLLFGLGHFPQGWGAVVRSGVNGLMYLLLFALTGSLLLPIILHIFYDARIAWTSSIILKQKEAPLT
ncbi:CPBP family intramembrane glutamic endopeptidase [Gorillibacterium sp. sgz5001074]|uniref:CPBP family intramembrane glutamic endopeptidase n=1 Tax=Gorillibacterium sp. sgz5001074 TaxID=3446695 RepID=UPI003F663779